METTWKRNDVTKHYLEQVRGGIPFGAEQSQIMLQVVKHFVKKPELSHQKFRYVNGAVQVLDLGQRAIDWRNPFYELNVTIKRC